MVGRSSVLCQADGTWTRSQLPTCIPVQCPVPHSPAHGKATFTAVAYKVSFAFALMTLTIRAVNEPLRSFTVDSSSDHHPLSAVRGLVPL